jgi:hypothetical protein
MKYRIFEHHNIYSIITERKDGAFVSVATCLDKASAEMIEASLNAKTEAKKEKKNARA